MRKPKISKLKPNVHRILFDIAEERGSTVHEILVSAVEFYNWLDDTVKDGFSLLIERDGEQRKVVLPPNIMGKKR